MTELPEHVPVLDGLRGLAIALVMISHLAPQGSSVAVFPILYALTWWGWVGVDVFFVLSGFLITRILLRTRHDPHYFRNFYTRRALRIFPAYYVALPILLYGIAPIVSPADVPHLYALQGWFWLYGNNLIVPFTGITELSVLGHFWSLAVEEHFYWVWPLVIRRLRVLPVCVAVLIGAPVLRCGMAWLGVSPLVLYGFTPCRVDALLMGGLVAVLLASDVSLERMRRFSLGLLMVLAPALVGLVLMAHGFNPYSVPFATVGFSVIDAIAAALLVLLLAARPSSLATRLCTSAPLTTLGKYSYAMYIYHVAVFYLCVHFSVAGRAALWFGVLWPGIAVLFVVEFVATLAVAWVSWHLIEAPCLRLKARFTEAP